MFDKLIDAVNELQESLVKAHADIAKLRAEGDRKLRVGKVTDVDTKKHLYRQEIGVDDEGNPVKSPWRPYSQEAGKRKRHSPPSVGQQMLLVSPGGDFSQGVGIPWGWSNDNPSPSTDDDQVETFGSVKIRNDGKGFSISIGEVSLSVSSAGVAFKGGKVTHNDHDVGAAHKHKNVQPGGGFTGETV